MGSFHEGRGDLSTGSRVLDPAPFSPARNPRRQPGTNPQELLGAALAGCFTTELTQLLDVSGLQAQSIETDAVVEFDDRSLVLRGIRLSVRAQVPGTTPAAFAEMAQAAMRKCPLGQALSLAVSLDVRLEEDPAFESFPFSTLSADPR